MDGSIRTPEIFNFGGREIRYFFSPAIQENRPIIIIMHGHGYASTPSRFVSPGWNVVCPMDGFGEQNFGSWYLGECSDMFWLGAMEEIINRVRARAGNGRLYFWGSSMGGYGAILHGYRNRATAVYANVPQTILLGSSYSKSGMKKYFEPIFGAVETDSPFNDLRLIFTSRSRTKIFMCFNQLERANYLSEQCFPFVQHLQQLRQKFYLEIRPLEGHGKNHGVSEAISLFQLYKD